jgi:hypothetical protein
LAHSRILVPLLAIAALVGDPLVAAAADARSDDEIVERLAFMESRLDRATPRATLWWSGWYYGYMAITVGQAGFALAVKDRGLRIDTAVGAAFSSVGVVGLGAFEFPPLHASARLAALPARTPEERRKKLARAERLLEACARSEALGRSWIPHVAGRR